MRAADRGGVAYIPLADHKSPLKTTQPHQADQKSPSKNYTTRSGGPIISLKYTHLTGTYLKSDIVNVYNYFINILINIIVPDQGGQTGHQHKQVNSAGSLKLDLRFTPPGIGSYRVWSMFRRNLLHGSET